jgi:hypothetical protein
LIYTVSGEASQTGPRKAAFLVKINPAGCGGPVRQEVFDRAFEDLVVVSRGGTGWPRHGKAERVAELVQEHDVVGALPAAFAPCQRAMNGSVASSA